MSSKPIHTHEVVQKSVPVPKRPRRDNATPNTVADNGRPRMDNPLQKPVEDDLISHEGQSAIWMPPKNIDDPPTDLLSTDFEETKPALPAILMFGENEIHEEQIDLPPAQWEASTREKTVSIDMRETMAMPGVPPISSVDMRETMAMPEIPSTSGEQSLTNTSKQKAQLKLVASTFPFTTDNGSQIGRATGALFEVGQSFSMFDSFAIDKQATWLLPVVPTYRGSNVVDKAPVETPLQVTEQGENAKSANYASTLKQLLRSSGIYALASFVSPLIALVLAPFLTNNLSHAEYGALAVCMTAIALLVGMTQVGLNHAFFRAYSCDYEDRQDRLRVVSTLVALLLLISVPAAIILFLSSSWVAVFLLGDATFSNAIKLVALAMLLQNLTVPGFSWLRAEGRATTFAFLSILNLLVSLTGNLVLVGVFHFGLAGSLLAVSGGYGAVVVCSLPIIIMRTGLRIRLDIVRNMLSFGLPLVASFVSVWILQLSDRYLLSHLGSLAQTGSYAVAYTLGNVMGAVVLAPFSLAWPSAMFTVAKRDDAAQIFQLIFRWYSLGMLFVTFVFSLVSTCILFLFFPPSYHSAYSIIPIIALSIMFYGIYDMFCIGVGVRRKTWYAVVFTGFAATTNILCNLFLIPLYGSMGAALATLIAYVLLAIVSYCANQRIYPIPFEIGKFLIALGVGIALYVGAGFVPQHNPYIQAAIYLGALCLYALFLVFLGNPLQRHVPARV